MFILTDLLIFIFIFFLIKSFRKSKGKIQKDAQLFLTKANNNDINISKHLYLPYDIYPKMIIIDDIKKKVHYLYKPNKKSNDINLSSYNYSDILKCELINNSHYETVDSLSTIRNRRISHEYVQKQGFVITVKDIINPNIEMNYIIDKKGVKCSFHKQIKEWISTFEIIIDQNLKKEIV
ncbi:hypothetical protein ACV3T9_10895 [Clostridium perfringens]